jgi:diadenosine tetraphosphate (Ap4A) HIT family hydrolase/orotate phosphoribosyltransferase
VASIFIASSTEGRTYAEIAASILVDHGEAVLPWWSDKAFPISRSLVDSLQNILENVDAALIVATSDDKTTRRGQNLYSPAHNVILEFGLFAGHLGIGNVALAQIGSPSLPSDLDGLATIRFRPMREEDDSTLYRDTQMKPQLIAWLESIEANSSDGARISRLVDRLAPGLRLPERITLKADVLRAQINTSAFPKQPPSTVEHLILKYTSVKEMGAPVGYDYRSSLDSYVNLADIPPSSEDERALAGHLARYVAELSTSKIIKPTLVAVSKTATQGLLQAAARLLPYPIVLVSPTGPSRTRPVEGFYELGDRAVLLHDVALSGHHLVDCIVALRSVGIECNELIALTRHQAGIRELNVLMRENKVNVRTASAYMPERGRVECGDLSLSESLAILPQCVLCDVLEEREAAPIRTFITRDELPTEKLAEVDGFVAISDVAPLTPGHTLLVTKQHILAMNRLSKGGLMELDNFRQEITAKLGEMYGMPVLAFEHGLCNRAAFANCGIDHAHLHVLPTGADLEEFMREDFDVTSLNNLHDLGDATKGFAEYLLLINADDRLLLACPSKPVSQYFRRRMAKATGRELWNWNDEVILGTSSQRKDWILSLHSSWHAHPIM